MTVDQPTPDFSRDELYGNFWNLYHRQIDRWSDNLAVRTKNYRLTFRELNRRANGIAAALNEPGGKRSIGVGLLLTDAPDIAPAFIGVMKAGHIVVYMDSAFPKSRLSYMLVDASVGLIITNNANYALAIDLIEDENRIINISQPELPGVSENPVINSNLDDVIQILFFPFAPGYIAVIAITPYHLFSLVWHM